MYRYHDWAYYMVLGKMVWDGAIKHGGLSSENIHILCSSLLADWHRNRVGRGKAVNVA